MRSSARAKEREPDRAMILTLKRDENPDDIVPHEDGKVQKLRQIGLMCFENVHLQVL